VRNIEREQRSVKQAGFKTQLIQPDLEHDARETAGIKGRHRRPLTRA